MDPSKTPTSSRPKAHEGTISVQHASEQSTRGTGLGRQFLRLLEDEVLSKSDLHRAKPDAEHRQESSGASTMVERLQELLGEKQPPAADTRRNPLPLAQQIMELASAEDVAQHRGVEVGKKILEDGQLQEERGRELNDQIDEVPDSDSEGAFGIFQRDNTTDVASAPMMARPRNMMERFQEALLAAPKIEDHTSGCARVPVFGFSARLQRVIQKEKDQASAFAKSLSLGHKNQGSSRFLVLRIISRYLEARLSTCNCEVLSAPQGWFDDGNSSEAASVQAVSRIVQAIFSSKTSCDLDLEAGRIVRIQHPWQEITNAEGFWKIIICTYFVNMVAEQ